MARKVRYNGSTESHRGRFTSPKELVKGQEYELQYAMHYDLYTVFVLKGVKGIFNSTWFDYVESFPPTFLAVSCFFPKRGQRLRCYRADYNPTKSEEPIWVSCLTSYVREIKELGTNIFYVETINSAYIVEVSR